MKTRLKIFSLLCLVALPISAVDFVKEFEGGVTLSFSTWNSTTGFETSGGTEVRTTNAKSTKEAMEVVIPSTVDYNGVTYTVTGVYGFQQCSWLTKITIPETVVSIGSFTSCSKLQSITIPNGITTITYQAFAWSGLKTINIPASVTEINQQAFYGCSSLESINLSEGLKSIGTRAFYGCQKVESLEIPNTVSTIGIEAFCGCSNLKHISMSSGLSNVGWSAFERCNALEKVTIDNLESWCGISFGLNGNPLVNAHHLYVGEEEVTNLVIPPTISKINNYAFEGATELRTATFHKNVTKIGFCAFKNCTGLEKVIIDDLGAWCKMELGSGDDITNPLYYAHHLYQNDEELTELIIPEGISSINYCHFQGFGGTSVELPSTIRWIGDYAFSDCENLVSVTFNGNLPSFGEDYVFHNTPVLRDVYFPACAYKGYASSNDLSRFTLHPQIKLSNEWNTYCTTATFEVPNGIEAYVVKECDGQSVTLQRTSTINEGQGLILKPASVGTAYNATWIESGTDYESNLLVGVTAATDLSSAAKGYTNFVLYNGEFRKTSSGTLPAYKAYLPLPTQQVNASKQLKVVYADETTGIKNASCNDKQHACYSMQGVCLGAIQPAAKGIYIVNGKKIIIK